jgi:hypothetical protein
MRRLGLIAAICCFPAAVCAAQGVGSVRLAYTLLGLVVDSAGAAVPQAQIELFHSGLVVRRLRSDTGGHFLARDLQDRALDLRVRHLGYAPESVSVSVPATLERADVRVVLSATIAQLSATTVLGERDPNDVRLRSFYDRLANNKYGSYIEPKTIASRQPLFISELLRRVPGIKVQPTQSGNTVTIRGCTPVVWVDGARMQDAQVDDVVEPQDVAAIEIYRSFSGLPSQYFDRTANCGTIIVWTKVR